MNAIACANPVCVEQIHPPKFACCASFQSEMAKDCGLRNDSIPQVPMSLLEKLPRLVAHLKCIEARLQKAHINGPVWHHHSPANFLSQYIENQIG